MSNPLTPNTCQFVAYVGHRVEQNFKQCQREYGHPAGRFSGTHVAGTFALSDRQEIRSADGQTHAPDWFFAPGAGVTLARKMGYLS